MDVVGRGVSIFVLCACGRWLSVLLVCRGYVVLHAFVLCFVGLWTVINAWCRWIAEFASLNYSRESFHKLVFDTRLHVYLTSGEACPA